MIAPAEWPPLDVLVVGAQKAGSTHLADLLGRHAGVRMCPDEVPIFEDPFYANSDPAELAAALAGATEGQLRAIHRPDYLAHPEVPARVRAHAPEARVIAVLREPVARALSAYCWYLQFAMLPVRAPEEGLTALLDGWTDPAYPHAHEVLDYGRYGAHLCRWRSALSNDQLLILEPECLTPHASPQALLEFLGLPPQPGWGGVEARTNEGVYERRRLRVMRARARFAFSWDSTDRYTYKPRRRRRPVGSAVAAATTLLDRHVLARVFGNEAPTITADLRARLSAHYADDTRLLAEEILGHAPSWTV